MLNVYKIEFYTGHPGLGPFCYVLARSSQDAEVLAKAQRLLSGSTDTRVEHAWQVKDAVLLAKIQTLAATGLPRILDLDALLAG